MNSLKKFYTLASWLNKTRIVCIFSWSYFFTFQHLPK